MLRILDDVKTADLYSINWSGGDKRFELRYQPTLLFALLNCDRLVDSKMQPVTVSHEQAEIVLCMEEETGDGKGAIISPTLKARTEGQPLQRFQLLSDGNIASPKIPLLIEQVEELVAGGHKVVIFFNFIAGIELVGERLTEMGIDYTTMTGSTHDRRAVVERFQNDPGCRALLMTLKTGGVGLNLTVADTVYIVEPWYHASPRTTSTNRD